MIQTKIIPSTWLNHRVPHGYGNGYVGVPPGHPWHGLDYDTVHDKFEVSVHGGLTYAGKEPVLDDGPPEFAKELWWLGFDTCHLNDNEHSCSQSYVESEVQNLKQQAEEAKPKNE